LRHQREIRQVFCLVLYRILAYSLLAYYLGPIARIGPNALITSSPEVWIHINTKPGYNRSDWYFKAARLEHRRDHIFSQRDNLLHDERRKQIAPGVRILPLNPTLSLVST
jgi:hypothetical protein